VNVVKGAAMRFEQLPGRASADPLAGIASESSMRIVRLVGGIARRAHLHPLSEEVVVVAAGNGVVWIEGERTPVAPGDVVRIPPGARHATLPAPGTEMTLHCFFPHPDLAHNIEETDIALHSDETDSALHGKEEA
jgi:mannose-6-phosphate isomerase-like protein (cupin superfamily)